MKNKIEMCLVYLLICLFVEFETRKYIHSYVKDKVSRFLHSENSACD